MKTPPRVATFILGRLGPQNDVLVGDLTEEYLRRQSVSWYWRQVLVAVALHLVADVRGHWLIALRGTLIGLLLLLALGWTVAPISAGLHRWVLRYMWGVNMQFQIGSFIHWTLWFPASIVAGWIVARLHQRHQATAVLGLVLTLGLFAVCNERFYFLVRNSLTHERFVPYLMFYLLGHAVGMAGVLVGGFMQPITAHRAELSAPPR